MAESRLSSNCSNMGRTVSQPVSGHPILGSSIRGK